MEDGCALFRLPPWVASFIESFVGFEESEMRFHVTLYDVG